MLARPRLVALVALLLSLAPVRAAAQPPPPSPGDALAAARALERSGATDQALADYEALVARHPDAPQAAEAHAHAGRLRERHLGDLVGALAHYRGLAERFPDARWTATARTRIAEIEAGLVEGVEPRLAYEEIVRRHTLRELDRAATVAAIERWLERHPTSHTVPRALAWIADAEVRLGRSDRAEARYRELAARFPGAPEARAARWALADLAFRRGEYAEAVDRYTALYPAETPDEALDLDRSIERSRGHLVRRRGLWAAVVYLAVFGGVCGARLAVRGRRCGPRRGVARELAVLAPGLAAVAGFAYPNRLIVLFVAGLGAASAAVLALDAAAVEAHPPRGRMARLYPLVPAAAVTAAAYVLLYALDLAFVLEGSWR